MILILTYHKVLREAEAKPEFYSIKAGTLERHLDLLAQSGFRALQPDELISYQADAKPAYLLTFDDGTRDHYEVVLPLLSRYNSRAVFFVPTAKLNREGYLSSATVQEISRQGQTIGLHSHEHRRLDVMGEEDIRVQMQLSTEILEKLLGVRPVLFAPPGGFINQRVRNIASETGVRAIRTMRWGYNKNLELASLDCVPVNGAMTETQFRQALEFRSMAFGYFLKEVAKALIPTAAYAALRDGLFGKLRRP